MQCFINLFLMRILVSRAFNCCSKKIFVFSLRVVYHILCETQYSSPFGVLSFFLLKDMFFRSQFARENNILNPRILKSDSATRQYTVIRNGTFFASSSLTTIPSHF